VPPCHTCNSITIACSSVIQGPQAAQVQGGEGKVDLAYEGKKGQSHSIEKSGGWEGSLQSLWEYILSKRSSPNQNN
jgi:hypothetical protein